MPSPNPQNHLGQPIGAPLPNWNPPPRPRREPLRGRFGFLVPLEADRHAADLFAANGRDTSGTGWTYLAYGPFATLDDYRAWMESTCRGDDPFFYAIIDGATKKAVGVASYLRIDPKGGAIEIGHIRFSPQLQRTPLATEAIYLMIDQAFDLGYRRCEWKCDALNTPSRTAAQRLGFSFEGIFRQATVYKQRNRDTAWYSIIDSEWPTLKMDFARWLAPENFDERGVQRQPLSQLTAPLLARRG